MGGTVDFSFHLRKLKITKCGDVVSTEQLKFALTTVLISGCQPSYYINRIICSSLKTVNTNPSPRLPECTASCVIF